MTQYLPATQRGTSPLRNKYLTPPATRPKGINDNGPLIMESPILQASLRHFSRYGLAAIDEAIHFALAARAAGDERETDHWLAICHTLDPRRAKLLQRRLSAASLL